VKTISVDAYQALREALAVITWNKRPFETLLRTALRESPEVLTGLNFNEPKRVVADQLVDRLVERERTYQDVTVQLMLEIASMSNFPNVEQIKDAEDRVLRLSQAQTAVARLKSLTTAFSDRLEERERSEASRQAVRAQSEAFRRFADEIEALKQEFIQLQAMTDPRKRGKEFEGLLSKLFRLFDMEPRLSYSLDREQIDGSLTFDTDDYIVEARWRQELVDRRDADIFSTQVRRKGKNALGLMVSVNGFTSKAIEQYSEATSFITMDGSDLYLVLDQRLRLDDVLKAKRRHANETGSCHLPSSRLLGNG
jgi:hypothetical protein